MYSPAMVAAILVGTALQGAALARANFDELSRIEPGAGTAQFAQQAPAHAPSPVKSQDRLPGTAPVEALPDAPPAVAPPASDTAAEQVNPNDPEGVLPNLEDAGTEDDFSVGEIPDVETVELTPETARKAIDAYVMVRDKYKDAELENYENLQDFVDQTDQGKSFEADIRSFGFAGVNDWNVAVTMVGFAYSNIVDDQSEDIRLQITEIEADTELAQDMRDRLVAALKAMIPSDNNRKIIEELLKDASYADKVKLLESEEEEQQ